MDAVLQQPVTNKNMDRSGPEGTMGHVNFPKLLNGQQELIRKRSCHGIQEQVPLDNNSVSNCVISNCARG